MPESSARESTRRARSITGPSTILPFRNHAEAFASGGFSGFYDAAGVIHFFLGRCVEVVQQINLTRVDQRFAVKAQLFDVGGFLQESGFVVSVGIDGIERLNTRRTRGLQNGAASEQQFSSFRERSVRRLRT